MAKLNFISFDEPKKFEAALAQLVEALSTDIGWVRQHTTFGLSAGAWERAGRPNGLLLRSPRLEEAELWIAKRPQNAPLPTDLTAAFVRESRRATTRRRNILTGSLASGLVIALVLAGIAFRQRGIAIQNEAIANAQRNRAEKTLALATGTANGLVFDLARKLLDVVCAPVSLVKTILDRAIKLQDDLTSAGETSPALRRSQSVALNETVLTLLTIGDTQEALAAAQKSLAIARDLAKEMSNVEVQRDLAVSIEKIGDVKLQAGDRAGALAAYEEVLVICHHLAGDKGNAEAQGDLSVSFDKIGDVKLRAGDLKGALAACNESVTIFRELGKGNGEAQRNLTVSFNRMADVKLRAGDTAGALATYEESLAIRRVLAKDKGNAEAQRDLAGSLEKIGDVKLQLGNRAGAFGAYEEELAICRDLAKDKGNVHAQRNLSVSLNKMGEMKLQAGDRTGALADKLGLKGVVWTFIAALNDSLSNFGLIVIGVFVSCWLLSVAIYRWRGYDNLVTEQGQCE